MILVISRSKRISIVELDLHSRRQNSKQTDKQGDERKKYSSKAPFALY